MKMLLCGCAAVALCVGLAGTASAQVEVKTSPIHAIPGDADGPREVAPAEAASTPGLNSEEAYFFTALGHRITDSASAYEGFVRQASAIDPAFSSGASVRSALRTGSAYQPNQLQEGIVAFAALLALRDQAFVDAVRSRDDPEFAERLLANPSSVLAIPGADRAAADVTEVLRDQGAALQGRGAAITQAAYDVQAQGWSRQPVPDAAQALAAEKASAIEARSASVDGEKLLLHTVMTARQDAAPGGAAVSPQVVRGLALAALAVRGRTGDREEARFQSLMHDEISAACLKMAKLNLDQCIAAAGPHYEHVFCVGRHAVGETAKCVSAAATGDGEPATTLLPRTQTASVERYGPEAAAGYGYAPQRPDADEREPADDRGVYQAPDGQGAAPPARYAQAYATQPYGREVYAPRPNAAQSYASQAASPAYGARDYSPPYGAPRQGAYADSRYAPPPDDSRVRYQDANNGQDPSADDRFADPRGPY
jgi:hypothetical protein